MNSWVALNIFHLKMHKNRKRAQYFFVIAMDYPLLSRL